MRSLSQALDDDSLNYKKAHAWQVQAQARMELEQDELQDQTYSGLEESEEESGIEYN